MAATPPNQAQPQYSPDGRWWWDGQRWVPAAAGGIVPTRPNRYPWGVYSLIGCGAVALLLIVAIVIGSVLSAPRSTPRTATQTPSASPIAKASLPSVQVVAEGIGGRSVGAVLKNMSQNYVFAFSYKATLYDAQGAQVGVFSMLPDVNLLPGEMVSIEGGGDATAPAARFILTLNPDHFACAYPVLKMLYDSAGHLTGMATGDRLTTADGPTPVHIVFDESFTYSGFPNPWGPVAMAMVSAYDDLRTLPSGVLGDCQHLTA
jgi:hypothetical protein